MRMRRKKRKLFALISLSTGFLLTLLIVVIVASLFAFIIASNEASTRSSGGAGAVAVPIQITGTYNTDRLVLNFTGGITATGVSALFKNSGKYTGTAADSTVDLSLPTNENAVFQAASWMPQFDQKYYTGVHLDISSAQYALNKNCSNDKKGFRKKDDAYLVALGTFYGKVGDKFQLTFSVAGKEKTITAVMGDAKSDGETDSNHQFHENGDGSVVEFIMARRDNQNGSVIRKTFGTLTKISKRTGKINVTAVVKRNKISITGTCSGIPFTASGTIENDRIDANGLYGNVSLGNGKLLWPITTQCQITSWFGARPASDTGGIGSTNHGGIDLAVNTGTNVIAADSGTVTLANWYSGYGKCIMITHKNGLITVYGHLSKIKVQSGQLVSAGQTIGLSGNTGNSTGPHLHFEVRRNGAKTDPLSYLVER